MKEKIEALTRDVEIHQDVEKELAKRSHFSQKIIKKLKDRVRELEIGQKARHQTIQHEDLSEAARTAEQLGATPGRNRRKNGHSLSVLWPKRQG